MLGKTVPIVFGKTVKIRRAFFIQDNGANLLNITVTESISLFVSDSPVLSQKQVRGVAGGPLAGKQVAHFLDLQIDHASILQLYHQIHDHQGIQIPHPGGFQRMNMQNPDFPIQKQREECLYPLWLCLRIQNDLEKGIIQNLDSPLAGAVIQKTILLFRIPFLIPGQKFRGFRNFRQNLSPAADCGKILFQSCSHTLYLLISYWFRTAYPGKRSDGNLRKKMPYSSEKTGRQNDSRRL